MYAIQNDTEMPITTKRWPLMI